MNAREEPLNNPLGHDLDAAQTGDFGRIEQI